MHFRQDIAGLRAVAVLSVLLFHFSIPGFSGGFAGVDVFFVISGYLMASIVLTGIKENRFKLIEFYLSRFKRIFPPLVTMALTVCFFCYFIYEGDATELMSLAKHAASSLTFLSNFIYFSEAGYFDSSAYTKWLLHTWSLSIEWQFYTLFPLLLLLVKNISFQLQRLIITAVFLLSLGLSILLSGNHESGAFFLLHTRAWELLAGALVFFWPIQAKPRLAKLMVYIGLALITMSIWHFHEAIIWPGYYALIPVVGTVLILAANTNDTYLLNNTISQGLGKISYSLYLWHWPVVILLHHYQLMNSMLAVISGILFSLLLAQLSFQFIEQKSLLPFKSSWKNLAAYSTSTIALAATLLAGGYQYYSHAPENKVVTLSAEELLAERKRYWKGKYGEKPFPKDGERKILVIGNSWAIDLMYALKLNGLKGDIDFLGTSHHCLYFGSTPVKDKFEDKCKKINQKILNSNLWKEADEIWIHDFYKGEKIDLVEKRVLELSQLTDSKIYIFGPKMDFKKDIPRLIRDAVQLGKFKSEEWQTHATHYQQDRYIQNKALQQVFSTDSWKIKNVFYVNTLSAQCKEKQLCRIIDKSGHLFYFDSNHLTLKGAEHLGKGLKRDYAYLFNSPN